MGYQGTSTSKTTVRFPLRRAFAVLLLLLPRVPIAYAGYVLAPFLIVNPLGIIATVWPLFATLGILLTLASMRAQVSLTSFLIEVALITPFLVAILAAHKVKLKVDVSKFMRDLNVAAFALSILNMAFLFGFPVRLPYVHFAPDYYNALFGLGGARIVSIIGFFGLFNEMMATKRKVLPIVVALLNFVVPSSLLVTAFGFGAIGVLQARKASILLVFALCIAVPAVGAYGLSRLDTINSTFSQATGHHPKVFAYLNLLDVWGDDVASLLFGVGAGQYASEPVLWVSLSSSLTTSQKSSLPGLFTPQSAKNYLFAKLAPFQQDSNSLGSSFNKPFTSYSTMLAELGVPIVVLITALMFRQIVVRSGFRTEGVALFLFVLGLLAIDQWHDDPWFGTLLLLTLVQMHTSRGTREAGLPLAR